MIINVFYFAGVVQYLQFRYQRGQLYRLKALGERYNMDITIEGFHSWMWRGLSFLLPFLFGGYIFQLYNAYVLCQLSFLSSATWHVSKFIHFSTTYRKKKHTRLKHTNGSDTLSQGHPFPIIIHFSSNFINTVEKQLYIKWKSVKVII